MTSREQFERTLLHRYGDDYLIINSDGDYSNWIAADLWEFWQASRAAIEVEIDSYTEFEIERIASPEKEGYSIGWIDGRNYAAREVEKAGIKIKGDTK